MAGAIDLPEVTQKWVADVGEYVAAMQAMLKATRDVAEEVIELQAEIDALHGKNVRIGFDAATTDAAAAAAAVNDLAAADGRLFDILQGLAEAEAAEAAAANAAADAMERHAAATALLAGADEVLAAAQERVATSAGDVAARVAEAAATIERFGRYQSEVVAGARDVTNAIEAEAAPLSALRQNLNDAGIAALHADDSMELLRNNLRAAEWEVAARGADDVAAALVTTAAAADKSGQAAGRAWQPWFLLGNNWKTALHWIVAGGAELAAVVVPAMIAFGAGTAVALQGSVNVANHMQALWTAAEATGAGFHQTLGTLLGLRPALQQAQDAANPGVYEILGSAVNDVRARFEDLAGTGLQVVHMFDEFSARVTTDLQGSLGTRMQGMLTAMIPDLQEIGQVFGNLGHAILNFASDMPGLAELLLKTADAISHLILDLSNLPRGLVMSVMALEEFFRWGGLVIGILVRLGVALGGVEAAQAGNFITKFGAGLRALVMDAGTGIAALGNLITRMSAVTGEGEAAGAAIEGFGTDIAIAGAEMSAGMAAGIAGAIAGIAILIVAMSRIKDATDQWVASTDKAVAAASDLTVLGTISRTLTENQIRLAGANVAVSQSLKEQGTQTAYMTARFGEMNGATQRASQDQLDLTLQQQHLISVAHTVSSNLSLLGSHFHISAAGALALANAAGINLQTALTRGSEGAKIAYQQIKNLETGLGAMGAPMGVVGNDMEALGVQSQLAGTKVSQLNQAWDQFVSGVTGGMSSLVQLQGALTTMGSDAQASSISLTGSIGSISRSAQAMGYTLKGMGQNAQQSWQQFNQALGTGEQAIDFLRTGMAEGMVSVHSFGTSIHALVGEMLPFTDGNKTAVAELSTLAQQAGGPATTSLKALADWAGVSGGKAKNELAKGMEDATQKMANLSQVAQNLSAVVGQQLDAAFAQAAVKASGMNAAYQKYATDIAHNAPRAQLEQDLRGIANAQATVNRITQAGVGPLNNASQAASSYAGNVVKLHNAIDGLHSKTVTVTVVEAITSRGGQLLTGLPGERLVGGGQHGGVLPGYQPGVDSVPMMLSHGEGILNPYAVRMLGANFVHWANATAERGGGINPSALRTGGAPAYGGGGGGGTALHVYLDGKEIFGNMKVRTLDYNTRNSGQRTGKWIPS